MEVQVTPLQFLLGVITVLAPQIYNIIKAKMDARNNAPLTAAQGESAMGDALEKLGQAYDRALQTIKSQDDELAGLRPLILELGLTKQQCAQTQLDKEDWKTYAMKLATQLEENKIIPIAFRRASLDGDSEKMRAISQAAVDKYIGKREDVGGGHI